MRRLFIALCLLLAACTGDDGGSAGGAAVDTGVDADVGVDTGTSDAAADAPICEGIDPAEDTDGDGLEDGVEDADLDCEVDDDETDPLLTDTDGDGLDDGLEDVDRNGSWDAVRGELDPRVADTDGDGTLDGAERIGRVCTSNLLASVENRRLALGTRYAVYTPAEGVVEAAVAGDEPTSILLGAEGEAAVLSASLPSSTPSRLLDAFEDAFVDADVAVVSERVEPGGLWEATVHVDAPDGITLRNAMESWARSVGLAVPEPPGAERSMRPVPMNVRGQIEAYVDDNGMVAGRVAFAVAPEGRESWVRALRTSSISDAGRTRLRAMCEEPAFDRPEAVDVVLVLNAGSRGEQTREAQLNAVAGLLDLRSAAGLETRLWVITTDAHLYGAAGALVDDEAFEDLDGIEDAVSMFASGSADQRVWLNARAALDFLVTMELVGDDVVLVVAANGEDTEFREGTFEGREGDPSAAPMPSGEDRATLTTFYASTFRERGVTVIATAPRTACGESDDAGRSFRDVAVASGGTFVDRCADPDGSALSGRLNAVAGPSYRLPLMAAPVGSTMLATFDEQVLDGLAVEHVSDGVTLFVPSVNDRAGVAAAYLFWDEAVSAEQRR